MLANPVLTDAKLLNVQAGVNLECYLRREQADTTDFTFILPCNSKTFLRFRSLKEWREHLEQR
jgi:hypothetical protein